MAFEQKDNSGALFKNDKGDNPARPDYTGNGMVNGQEVRISAWVKEGAKGKFMSLSFQEPMSKSEQKRMDVQQPTKGIDSEDIPFN